MKLNQIASENIISKIANKKLHGSKLFNRAALHTQKSYDGNSGDDSANKTAGFTYLPTGMPHKARHRIYFGLNQ